MVSAITTFETIDRLYERLAAWCVVEVDGQRFNFRFPNTRRLPAIFGALTDVQRAEMAGSAASWRYIDRDGTWRQLACVLPKDELPVTPHAQLDEEQFGRMVSDSEPDEMWVQLEGRGVTTRLRASRRHAVLSAALSLARKKAGQHRCCTLVHRLLARGWRGRYGDARRAFRLVDNRESKNC